MADEGAGLLSSQCAPPPREDFYTSDTLVWLLCGGNTVGAVAHGVGIALTLALTWCTQYELPMFTITTNATVPGDPPRYLGDGVNTTRVKPVLEECCPLDPRAIIVGFFSLSCAFHVFFALVLFFGRPRSAARVVPLADGDGDAADAAAAPAATPAPAPASIPRGFAALVARWYLQCLADCRAPWYAPSSPSPRGPTFTHTRACAAGGGSSMPSRRRCSSRSRCDCSAPATSSCCGR